MTLQLAHRQLVDTYAVISQLDWDRRLDAFGEAAAEDDVAAFLRSFEVESLRCENGSCSLLSEHQRSLFFADECHQLVRTVAGRTLIVQKPVGDGGQGSVVVARLRTRTGDRLVAIKQPKEKFISKEESLRFAGECRALCETVAGSEDPRRIYVVEGLFYDSTKDSPSIVMDWLDGPNLRNFVRGKRKEGSQLSLLIALRISKRLLDGVSFLHSKGIVHRDIKPANVIALSDDSVCLVDLGYMKDLRKRHTKEGRKFGTLFYTAPECFQDASKATKKADVFSVCATIHFLLTARPPHYEVFISGEQNNPKFFDDLSVWLQGGSNPVDLRKLRREVPVNLANVISDGLAATARSRPTLRKLLRVVDETTAMIEASIETLEGFRSFRLQCFRFVRSACADLHTFEPHELAISLRREWQTLLHRIKGKYPKVTSNPNFLDLPLKIEGAVQYRRIWKKCSKLILKHITSIGEVAKHQVGGAEDGKTDLVKLKLSVGGLQALLPDLVEAESVLTEIVRGLTHTDYPEEYFRAHL